MAGLKIEEVISDKGVLHKSKEVMDVSKYIE